MPEDKKIQSLYWLWNPFRISFGHSKRYQLLHRHFKRKIWELCCYRDMCLNVCL